MLKMLPNVKKVMHITYDMRIGGTEMVIKNIIEGVDSAHFEQSIFCIEHPIGPWGLALQESGISIHSHARKPGFDASLISVIRKHIKEFNIDIVHCHQYTPWVYGLIATLGLNKKVIFTEHGRFYPDSSSWKRRFINPVLSMFTDNITAISEATKQALVDYEFIAKAKVSVIYNGIRGLKTDSAAIETVKSTLNISNNDLVFGTIARLDPIKNHEMMLQAFAKLLEAKPQSKLIIVGDGELMQALQSQAKALKIETKVIFTGYIAYPKEYLAIFDIFLLSSLSEGTSMTLLEAMSLSKPCIVTDAGGNKEIVANEETGLVTDNNDVVQFTSAMQNLAASPQKMEEFGQNAKQKFDSQFTDAIMAKAYEHEYSL
jgi:glycosyltransferase involved in cell wall biosynthesis